MEKIYALEEAQEYARQASKDIWIPRFQNTSLSHCITKNPTAEEIRKIGIAIFSALSTIRTILEGLDKITLTNTEIDLIIATAKVSAETNLFINFNSNENIEWNRLDEKYLIYPFQCLDAPIDKFLRDKDIPILRDYYSKSEQDKKEND